MVSGWSDVVVGVVWSRRRRRRISKLILVLRKSEAGRGGGVVGCVPQSKRMKHMYALRFYLAVVEAEAARLE